ncbi:hypothetical protein ACVWYF_001411 [Hymenobacter sp. UYAg731]
MKHAFTFLLKKHARRGALLLALGAAGPAAWGQSFGPLMQYATGAGAPGEVALGDVNGDGRPDIVAVSRGNAAANSVVVLLRQVGGGFATGVPYPTGNNSFPTGVALGDVNNDGRLDIITANAGTSAVSVFLGQVGGTFAAMVPYTTGASTNPRSVALADVNADGRPDIISGNMNTTASILLGQAGGTFAAPVFYPSGGTYDLVVADLNADGRPDIVTADINTGTVGVALGQAGGSFSAPISYPGGGLVTSVRVGDINGDGRPDIVTANPVVSAVGVLMGQAGGTFAPVVSYSAGSQNYPQTTALGDVNGDGRLDVVTANGNRYNVGVLLGLAGGGLAPAISYPVNSNYQTDNVTLGDVNGDGRPDIIMTAGASQVGVLLNTGTYTPLATVHPTAADLTLAPNPAHEAFTVQLPAGLAPTQAELLNALGQVVRRPAVSAGSFTVATSGLAPGIYTLRLRAGGVALAHRVVVE